MTYDVAVIGAGVIGLSVARRLAREGVDVVVVDRDEPCTHASWAAAGMLSPQSEADEDDPFLSLFLQARELFPALADELRAETGLDVGYRAEGTLLLALSEEDEAVLARRQQWQERAGLPVERLEPDDLHRLESGLSPEVRWALRFAGDHQVDNRLLGRALWDSACAAGAAFQLGSGVRRLRPGGLELENGERIQAGDVVLAAGCWSGTIAGLPRPLPVEPVHGELVSIRGTPPLFRHTIGSTRGYLVPRADGRLIVGTTAERIGFRKRVTAGGVRRILETGFAMSPALERRPLIDSWAGLRPGTPDGLPILGRDPELPTLVYATGHYRNGILLAPLTGELIAAILLGKETPDLHLYRPDRFAAS